MCRAWERVVVGGVPSAASRRFIWVLHMAALVFPGRRPVLCEKEGSPDVRCVVGVWVWVLEVGVDRLARQTYVRISSCLMRLSVYFCLFFFLFYFFFSLSQGRPSLISEDENIQMALMLSLVCSSLGISLPMRGRSCCYIDQV